MKRSLTSETFWSSRKNTPTANRNIDLVLGSAVSLPLPFWRERFFFKQAKDDDLKKETLGQFPAAMVEGKTHPVFTLEPLPDNVGFRVCPCSSKGPREALSHRIIAAGCRLDFSGIVTDRDSHVLHWFLFNIPSRMALNLRFQGQVPETCLRMQRREIGK